MGRRTPQRNAVEEGRAKLVLTNVAVAGFRDTVLIFKRKKMDPGILTHEPSQVFITSAVTVLGAYTNCFRMNVFIENKYSVLTPSHYIKIKYNKKCGVG